jgi:hypothetical protein
MLTAEVENMGSAPAMKAGDAPVAIAAKVPATSPAVTAAVVAPRRVPAPVPFYPRHLGRPSPGSATTYVNFPQKPVDTARVKHGVYVDYNNMYYIAKIQLGDRLRIDKLVKAIERAIVSIDPGYDVKNVFGHVYASRQLMSSRDGFLSAFETEFPASRSSGIGKQLPWFFPPDRKFENNVEKNQDIDTFLVADAISEIVGDDAIKHVILCSDDKDLAPVLKKAREKSMKTTVIGYKDFMPTTIAGLADSIIYIG